MKLSVNTLFNIKYAFITICGIFMLIHQYDVKGVTTFKSEFLFYIFAFGCVTLFVGLFHVMALMFEDLEK